MLQYFRTLQEQPLTARRRFVVVATAFSFALILLLWVGVTFISRRSAETPAPSPTAVGELPEAPLLVSPAPETTTSPEASPASASPVDVGQISTNLFRAFGPPPPKSP
ncbi:MAG: hypothetical protein G01um1014106_542 [Parcubacteria group bacterium Gr01-1014_106]|nr:MAG: hypothetical protein G01um1014106_542 [Parcubacteria group bacterium Gr01-1014_106]